MQIWSLSHVQKRHQLKPNTFLETCQDGHHYFCVPSHTALMNLVHTLNANTHLADQYLGIVLNPQPLE